MVPLIPKLSGWVTHEGVVDDVVRHPQEYLLLGAFGWVDFVEGEGVRLVAHFYGDALLVVLDVLRRVLVVCLVLV